VQGRNFMDFQKAVELINQSTNVLLTTHTKPDGDACGCVVAMCEMLESIGKKADSVFLSQIPRWYEFLFDRPPELLGKDINIERLQEKSFDLIVLLDVNSDSQLPEFTKFLKQNKSPILVIDHHQSNDGLGNVELVDSTAAATGMIILDLFKYAGWRITKSIAAGLFVAIGTDTGWFRFRNTDSRVFAACSKLIQAGAEPPNLFKQLYLNLSPERFRLMAAANDSVEFHFGGRLAYLQLTLADFEKTGASYEDTENLIDESRRIAGVEAAVLLVELADGKIRCSLRSTGPLDVCSVAEKLGGGGHKMAAGAYLDGPLEAAKKLIFEHLGRQIV